MFATLLLALAPQTVQHEFTPVEVAPETVESSELFTGPRRATPRFATPNEASVWSQMIAVLAVISGPMSQLHHTNPNKTNDQKLDFILYSADHIWANYQQKYANGRFKKAKRIVNNWL